MADKTINVRIQQKYDTEANWKAKDPVLLKGEQVFTSDGTNANKYKVGNGTAKWSALPYAKADLSKGDVTTALGYTPPTSNTWRGIQNNLTSDSTTDSLSAAQGKVLKGLVDGKAASSHTHDDRYYTESEMNTKLSGKSDTGHKHAISDVTNLQSTLDGKAASSHTHNYAGSSSAGGAANSANKLNNSGQITTVDALNNFNEASIFKYATMAALDGLDGLGKYDGIILSAPWSSTSYGHQIFLDDDGYTIAHRYRNNGTWSSWKTLIDSSNIGSQSVSHASTANSATTATQLSSSAGSSIQPIYFSGGKPVATTYTLGKSVPSNAVFTDTNTWRGIQNNLTSDSTSDSLSAAQGKILKGLVDGKAASGHNHDSVYSKLGHTHSYLPLSGGTMTGAISSSLTTGAHISGNKGTAIINSTAADGYNMLARMKSTNGVWTLGNYQGGFRLYYTSDSTISEGTNTIDKSVMLIDEEGNSAFNNISAYNFYGSLSGTAAKLGCNGDTSTPMTFYWAGKDGQPTWLWGGTDCTNMYVYDPSNFSVKYATSAGTSSATNAINWVAGNEIRFAKPGYTSAQTLWIGYAWADGSKSKLINEYKFADGNTGLAQVTASQFNGALNGNATSATSATKASSAAKWTTARTLSLTGSVTGSVTIDGSGNVSLATTTNHSHSSVNDSGSGAATTFAYSKAGMNYGDYSWLAGWNGTELRAVSKSQFATAGHTHNYAGSSSAGGVANSAAKLNTARSIALGGLSSGSANFDGSGNITIDNWGYGTKKYVTTDSTSAPYFRIAYCEDKGSYTDRSMVFVIDSGYSGGGFGIVKVALRNNNISTANQSGCELKWLVRQGFDANQLLVKGNAPAGGVQYADLYFKADGAYQAVSVTVLSMGGRGSKSRCWTFEEGAPRANPDIRTYSYTVEGSDGGTSSYANSAGIAVNVVDYGNTAQTIQIGYNGNGISGDSIKYIAGYTTGADGAVARIKDISKDALKSWIGSLPASDVYSWAKASSKPTYTKSEVGLGNVDNTADSAKSVKYATSAGSANSVAWANVSGKPSTYYTHPSYTAKSSGLYKVTVDSTGHVSATTAVTKADITGLGIPGSDTNTWRPLGTGASDACAGNDSRLSNARPASDVYSWAKASSKPSYSWSEITGKPGSFTPSSHTHDVIIGNYTGNGGQQKPSYIGGGNVRFNMMRTTINGDSNYKDFILMDTYNGSDVPYVTAIGLAKTGAAKAFIMSGKKGGNSWDYTAELLSTSNYTTYTVTKTGTGASGTWGINVTGSSGSCTGNAATATALGTSAGSATQPVYFSGGKPVACTYTLGKSVPSNAVFTDTNTWRGIQDNLTSTSTSDSLSANQGRILKAAVDGKAAASHTHSYLPLTGGTLSNTLAVSTGANEAQVNVINNAISGRLVASTAGRFGLYDVSYSRWVIMENTTDTANGPGGGLNNVVINSWNGVSFSTNCANQKYSNVTAVGIDCRNGIVKSNKLQLNSTSGSYLDPKADPTRASIYITTQQTAANFHPYMTVKTSGNHIVCLGGIENNFGFYSYYSSRTANGFDGQFGINAYNAQVQSDSVYNTTASTGTSNVVITPEHFIKRGSSASKYKLDIRNINENACYPYKILHINPRQWFDKGDTERYAEYLTDLYTDNIDENKPYALGDISLTPSYGLVAEDLEEAGLEKFCVYGKENEDGTKEVEGIQYDRLPILFIPILRDLVDCMQKVIPAVKGNITDEKLLAEVNELESRFATFSSDKIVKKTYDVEITSK